MSCQLQELPKDQAAAKIKETMAKQAPYAEVKDSSVFTEPCRFTYECFEYWGMRQGKTRNVFFLDQGAAAGQSAALGSNRTSTVFPRRIWHVSSRPV